MFIFKGLILILIFSTSSLIGIFLSKKYTNRVKNLKEFKVVLNQFETKIKYTYETIPEIFKNISNNTNIEISKIFLNAVNKMKVEEAGIAWNEAIDNSNIEINKEDKNVLKNLSKLLGKTNLEGQLSEIELTNTFLDKQIELAEKEKIKNEKLYKTLGICVGLVIVIILI